MSEGKYYWLKLRKDFFQRHDIRILSSMCGGETIVLFYLRLLCESVDHEGRLRFSDTIPYTLDMIGALTGLKTEDAGDAIDILENLGLVVLESDGTYVLPKVKDMIGGQSASPEAIKKRRQRDNAGTRSGQKGDTNGTQTGQEGDTSGTKCPERQSKSKSKRKSTEIETETETDKDRKTECDCLTPIPPSITEVNRYCDENGLSIDGEEFVNYFDAVDWTVDGEQVRNWKSLLWSWERHRNERSTTA